MHCSSGWRTVHSFNFWSRMDTRKSKALDLRLWMMEMQAMALQGSRMPNSRKVQSRKVDSIRHRDTRTNIPTEELRDFVREEEQRPQTVLYLPGVVDYLIWYAKTLDRLKY